jgi:hypothetical protein
MVKVAAAGVIAWEEACTVWRRRDHVRAWARR